ncbi:MAG: hypothetical protein PHP23_00165 [Desulfobacterales bacterium]|nr:hypothetical protein [Desulfobacterales bacterium]MDD4071573.1 hypothetical protein [Desulfobacterales bacterium]MDD4391563.1 hypothetical protein [Desulfobacterales bacterium]
MNSIYIGAGASFILGASGYFIVRYWLMPIFRYRKIKQGIVQTLSFYDSLNVETFTGPDKQRLKNISRKLRQYAAQLSTCYNESLPYKYKLYLNGNNESPLEASKALMALANIKQVDHAIKRADSIRNYLQKQD